MQICNRDFLLCTCKYRLFTGFKALQIFFEKLKNGILTLQKAANKRRKNPNIIL